MNTKKEIETRHMKPLEEIVFLGEIVWQIKIAQRAKDRLNPTDRIEVWSAIQLILIAAANVSKILWPPEKYKVRGEHLRKLLKIDDFNILFNRDFRNHFEHYDERMEAWFSEQPSAVYTDLVIDPLTSIWGDDPKLSTNKNRVYNPVTMFLTFRGESIDLAAILKALEDILSKCSGLVLT